MVDSSMFMYEFLDELLSIDADLESEDVLFDLSILLIVDPRPKEKSPDRCPLPFPCL